MTNDPFHTQRLARAEILHIAEPADQYVHLSIHLLGPELTAELLSGREPIGPKVFRLLEEQGLDAIAQRQLTQALQQRITRWSRRVPKFSLTQELTTAEHLNAWVVIPEDDDWPQQLSDLGSSAPFALWGRGDRELLSQITLENSLAVVGSRDASSYGVSATTHLVGDLAARGRVVLSGGAFGIDAVAHRSALATSTAQLPTVALMACGVDRPYPKHNENLLHAIIEHGLLLSEVPLGQSPTRWRFLQRNRIIAALSSVVVVVEARWRSGALNTAHHALEIGRELRAVPGQIFSPSSEGCHRLIQQGYAGLALSADSIEEAMNSRLNPEQTQMSLFADSTEAHASPQLTQDQMRIWDALPLREPMDVTTICSMTGAAAPAAMVILSQLQGMGMAEKDSNGWHKSKKYLQQSCP